jgi:hypothetical protein
VLQLRVYGDSAVLVAVAAQLNALPGARHVSLIETEADRTALVTADVRSDTADPALAMPETLGVPTDDIALSAST